MSLPSSRSCDELNRNAPRWAAVWRHLCVMRGSLGTFRSIAQIIGFRPVLT